jgi:hypothetical protein
MSGGHISWSETAGLRQVFANKPIKNIDPLKFLKIDYKKVSPRRVG